MEGVGGRTGKDEGVRPPVPMTAAEEKDNDQEDCEERKEEGGL